MGQSSQCLPPVKRAYRRSSPIASSEIAQPHSSMEDISVDPLSVPVGEPLLSDYTVHELPGHEESSGTEPLLDAALLSRIEALEAENRYLRKQLDSDKQQHFRLENISSDDALVQFYTGFISYELLLIFFEFLGPSVNKLHYWGTKTIRTSTRKRSYKLVALNQFFLTLVRLRLNIRVKDLAYRFGISVGLVSRYVTTWICFLYHHLREIE